MTSKSFKKTIDLDLGSDDGKKEPYLAVLARTIGNINFEQLQDFAKGLLDDAKYSRVFHLMGNGGCASLCQHAVTDFSIPSCAAVTGIRARTPMDNVGRLLMWINDTGWEKSLCNYINQEVKESDTVLFLSSSGAEENSQNLLNAARLAQVLGAKVCAIVHNQRTPLAMLCDTAIILPNETHVEVYETVSEAILHQLRILCERQAGENKCLL